MKNVVVVRLGGEIGIKSRPVRRDYEQKVLGYIKEKLKARGVHFSRLWRTAGRIYIETGDAEVASEFIARIFGISSVSPGVMTNAEVGDMVEMSLRLSKEFVQGSFAVKCKRVGDHPYTSQELAAKIGEEILRARPDLKVDLENPDQVLNLEIRDDTAIFYAASRKGPDGFPVGTQDPIVGVIDDTVESLVASWCMMKRGSPVSAAVTVCGENLSVHVMRNLTRLSAWSPSSALEVVIFPLAKRDPDPILHLFLASAYSKSKGLQAVVSGAPLANLGVLSELHSALPAPALFPLISIEGALLRGWMGMIGIDPENEVTYRAAIDQLVIPDQLDEVLRNSIEVKVREDGSLVHP